MVLAHISWPEIEPARSRVCAVPLGSLEQHGPHLPLWTDTPIVSEVAHRLERRPDAAVDAAGTRVTAFAAGELELRLAVEEK
jgi:creatinine amidohydrolase/Fe(II)-dependent formamide hydrolase-like protein